MPSRKTRGAYQLEIRRAARSCQRSGHNQVTELDGSVGSPLAFSTPLAVIQPGLARKANPGSRLSQERLVAKTEGKYAVELFREGAHDAGQEEIVDRHDNLAVARAIYRGRVSQYPRRLVMLRDRARVLARSDRPETMP
jgi:hypothetical protein